MTHHHSDQDRVWDLVEKIRICMFVTHDGRGDELRARPMDAHADREADAVWMLTDARHHKDDEVEINDNVCLTFADQAGNNYVSVSGTANVLDDRAKVHELWSEANKAWWDSEDDPNIRVLRIRPSAAEFWDGPNRIMSTVKMAAAALTGAKPDFGDNRKVQL